MSIFHKGEKITDYYKFENELGRGSFAIVKQGVNKKTGERVAIKIIERQTLGEDDELALQSEVEILSQLDHPNVVKLYEIYDDSEFMYLVLELMTGGELFDRIVEKEHYSEKEAADTIQPIVDAIRYCHSMGIVHRDLKPENLLYSSQDEKAIIKISDFGLARCITDELATTACGTPGYVAPEILNGKGYGKEVDYWSIGVILYILLCGFPPFYEENNQKLFEMIKNCQFDFPSPYWDDVSEVAKDLIKSILVVDPHKRMTAQEILDHPWVRGEKTPRTDLPNIADQFKKFNSLRKLKKAAFMVKAMVRMQKLAKILGK